MSMLKVIAPSSQEFDAPVMQMVKVSERGLRGNDLTELVKRASHDFVELVRTPGLIKAGDVPVHLIAIGATEFYGPNRNGDGFTESTCRDRHREFVKHARWYRNHANKNPAISYGLVKGSQYNERMHRIELLCVLNGTKEAARRNGGYVANEELEKLAREEDIPVSMACLIDYDVCSECGHRSKHKGEYCTSKADGGFCTRDGAKTALCRVYADGRIHHVDNPHPRFFDISKVFRPADRIAYTMGKLASAVHILGGAQLAQELNVTAPAILSVDEYTPYKIAEQIKLAYTLASIENAVEARAQDKLNLAFVKAAADTRDFGNAPGQLDSHIWSALAQSKVFLPVEGFLQLTTGDSVKAALAAPLVQRQLPGVYGRMIEDGSLAPAVENNIFSVQDVLPTSKARDWASKYAGDFSLEKTAVDRRIVRAAIYTMETPTIVSTKPVAANPAVEQLARSYALYKLAALQYLKERDAQFELTSELAIRQNYVI